MNMLDAFKLCTIHISYWLTSSRISTFKKYLLNIKMNMNYINGTIFSESANIEQILAEVAYVALCSYFNHFLLLIILLDPRHYNLQKFFKVYSSPVIIQTEIYIPLSPATVTQYIIFESNFTTLSNTLQWLSNYKFDNTGKYIISCIEEDTTKCNESQIFEICWKYKIVNVVYLKFSSRDNAVQYFTYFPHRDEKCENIDPVRLLANKNENACDKFFPPKFQNLNGCPVRVSTFIQAPYMTFTESGTPSGADGDLLPLIIKALNASLQIITPLHNIWGIFEENGTWSGSLGDIYYDKADLSVTSAALTYERYIDFQISISYKDINLMWVTCPPDLRPSWQKLLIPVKFNVHITITIIFLSIFILNFLITLNIFSELVKEFLIENIHWHLSLYSWMSFMGIPLLKLPKRSAFLIIVILWIWFSFILRTIYQSALITSLKENIYYPKFHTFEEAVNAKYLYGGGPAMKSFYIEEREIYNNWVNLGSATELQETLLKQSDGYQFVMAISETLTDIFLKKYNGTRRLQILPSKVIRTPSVIYLKKYSPFTNPINNVLINLTETGIQSKLYKDYIQNIILYNRNHDKEAITLEDYSGCYIILFLGHVISTISFLIELSLGYLKKYLLQ